MNTTQTVAPRRKLVASLLAALFLLFLSFVHVSASERHIDVRRGVGSKVLVNVRGKDIREGVGSKLLYNTTKRLTDVELTVVLHLLAEFS